MYVRGIYLTVCLSGSRKTRRYYDLKKKETKVNRAWLESGKEYVLTSVNHCRNVIFPLLSSLFSGWLLTWESNETFGVRTKVIPIEVFCIADSECVIFTSICCLQEGWPENISQLSDIIYTVHVIFLSGGKTRETIEQLFCFLLSPLIPTMKAITWKSLLEIATQW